MDNTNRPLTDEIFKRIDRFSFGAMSADLTDDDYKDDAKMARLREDHKTYENARKAVKTLADIVNGHSDGLVRAAIVDEITRTHRHLQTGLILDILGALGDLGALVKEDKARWTDDRNSFVMSLCKKLRLDFKDELFWSNIR